MGLWLSYWSVSDRPSGYLLVVGSLGPSMVHPHEAVRDCCASRRESRLM